MRENILSIITTVELACGVLVWIIILAAIIVAVAKKDRR